ncbi:HupE/UreJ family protein [Legionella sp. PC997]|uniref:HupE/UreJ family protein n=1 Tax=Legionella sp. PC997 TaxID=2755562 RepID=UPI0015F925E9|nr:HupE/UreJ family protein [Legionella sp. PC997]QMT61320.1 hypothetical protein HBNCFIEN_02715 [Legionella sp. PC997]
MLKIKCSSWCTIFGIFLVFCVPSLAFAHHAEFMRSEPFVQGLSMPIHGVDHMLFTLAVGLIAAQIGGRALWSIPLIFAVAMVLGGILNLSGVSIPLLEYGILASLIVCAGLLSLRPSVSLLLTIGLVALFTIFQGNEMMTSGGVGVYNLPLFILGTLFSSLLLLGVGVGVGLLISHRNAYLFRYVGVAMLVAAVVISVYPDINNAIIHMLEA